jgi:formylglycine-generating enzyme
MKCGTRVVAKMAVAGLAVVLLVWIGSAGADVFNLGGTLNADGSWNGLASLETVPVDDPNNAAADTGYGSVSYAYNIGKYEVTAGQYCQFLNAVAATDPYGLYSEVMSLYVSWIGGCNIQRTGSSGSYSYSVAADYANRPVNFVSWGDAARFTNWLSNGQPTGAQDMTTTENGTYYLHGATTDAQLAAVSRNPNAKWAIATENEWCKAAYYDPAAHSYLAYPTGSGSVPGRDMADASGNNANYTGTRPIDSGKYFTTVAGQFRNSASPYGTFDQGGNVREWNESILSGISAYTDRFSALCAPTADSYFLSAAAVTARDGDLRFSFGTTSYDVDLSAYDGVGITLNQLVHAINSAPGVSVPIAFAWYDENYSAYRLELKSLSSGAFNDLDLLAGPTGLSISADMPFGYNGGSSVLAHGLRGGSFEADPGCMACTMQSDIMPTYEDADIGFRVVQVPEPACLALLASGCVGLLRKR